MLHSPPQPPPSKRYVTLIIVALMLLVIGLTRLIDLQLFQHNWLLRQANANRYYDVEVTPKRGSIRDRFGLDLTQATQTFWLKNETQSLFAPDTRLDRAQALPILATESGKIKIEYGRRYPLKSTLAQVLGYVGKPTQEDLQNNQGILPEQWLGKTGLERFFDSTLRGQMSQNRFELSALGTTQRLISIGEPVDGQAMTTSLDSLLSQRISELMRTKKGAVIVMDGDTGEILSLISQPSYDPNYFTTDDTLSSEEKQLRYQTVSQWLNDQQKPLFNRALSGTYPPGSVFKLVTALAALESGAVTTDTEVDDTGILQVGDFAYANWYYSQYGRTDGLVKLRRAVAHSNDIFFYKAAEWTGPNRLADMARQLGFGSPTGVELPGEAAGLVPDPKWKEKQAREKWYLGNTYHMGIGQGDVLVTPLQVASLTQTILHEGQRCQPHLATTHSNTCESVGLDQEHVDEVIAGMVDACSPGGTGVPFFTWNQQQQSLTQSEGLRAYQSGSVACKTGTAEFGGEDARGRRKTHGWFTMGVHLPEVRSHDTMTATGSSQLVSVASASGELKQQWTKLVKQRGYPDHLIITVLVESDENQPYVEGSQAAAPIAYQILQWFVR